MSETFEPPKTFLNVNAKLKFIGFEWAGMQGGTRIPP